MPHGRGAVYYFFSPFQIIFFLCFKDIIQAINLLMFSKRFFFRILQNIRFWWLQIGSWILSSPCYFGLFPYFLAPFPNILVFILTATLYYFLSQINFSLISVVKYCESMGHLNSSWIHDQLTTAWKNSPYLVFQYISSVVICWKVGSLKMQKKIFNLKVLFLNNKWKNQLYQSSRPLSYFHGGNYQIAALRCNLLH